MFFSENKKLKFVLILAAVLLQITVLAFEFGGAFYPLYTGKIIKVKTVPVDPRSLFRGNYARLQFEMSRIPQEDIHRIFNINQSQTRKSKVRRNEMVYVVLSPGDDGLYKYKNVFREPPLVNEEETSGEDVYIRGRMDSTRPSSGFYRIRYGIEAFFAPKKKALDLEHNLRQGGTAVLAVASSGKVVIKDVISTEDMEQ